MKKYRYMFTGALAFVAFGCALFGDGAKIAGLITGQNAFVSAKDLKPGTFRKITVAGSAASHAAHRPRRFRRVR